MESVTHSIVVRYILAPTYLEGLEEDHGVDGTNQKEGQHASYDGHDGSAGRVNAKELSTWSRHPDKEITKSIQRISACRYGARGIEPSFDRPPTLYVISVLVKTARRTCTWMVTCRHRIYRMS